MCRPNRNKFWSPVAVFSFSVLLIVAGVISYELNPSQVLQFWRESVPPVGADPTILARFPHADIHYIRYLVAYPGLVADRCLNWPLHGQSIYVAFFIALNCHLWITLKRLYASCCNLLDPPFCCFLAIQIFLMNGRGVLIWSGLLSLLLSFSLTNQSSGHLSLVRINALLCLSYLLGTLSTGSFLVILTCHIFLIPRAISHLRPGTEPRSFLGFFAIPSAVILILALDYASKSLRKVFEFYSWSAAGLLSHGMFRFSGIHDNTKGFTGAGLMLIAFILLMLTFHSLARRYCRGELIVWILPAVTALMASAFGLTGGSLAIPPLLMYASINWPKRCRQ